MTPRLAHARLAGAAASLLALAACATSPMEDPRIAGAQQRLETLQADPYALTAAPGALERAEDAFERAMAAARRGNTDLVTHEIRMVDGNIQLAQLQVQDRRQDERIAASMQRRREVGQQLAIRGVMSARAETASALADAAEARAETQRLRAELEATEEQQMQQRERAMMMQQQQPMAGRMQANQSQQQQMQNPSGTFAFQHLQFAVDSTQLRAGGRQRLDSLVNYLLENENVRIRIAGHTDSTGSAVYNRQLSEGRAQSVAQYLESRGVDMNRIETEGYGESRPVTTNDTLSGREQNRRVEVTIMDATA